MRTHVEALPATMPPPSGPASLFRELLRLMPQDVSKSVIGVAAAATAMIVVGGWVWWASSLNTNVLNLTNSVKELRADVTTSAQLQAQVKQLERRLDEQQVELSTYKAWVDATRIKLAEQGFKTPNVGGM